MQQEEYTNLIIKHLSEGLTKAEHVQLENWLNEDPSHQTVKAQLAKAWKEADVYKSDLEVDEKAGWDKVARRIPSAPKVIPLWKKPWAAAAAIVFLLGLSWFTLQVDDNNTVEYATIEGETRSINLDDGSIVTLNENSYLAFTNTKKERLVSLKGEAFFEVSHDPSHPFVVDNKETKTTVLGTKFNVDGRDENNTVVSLLEGKVSFEVPQMDKVVLAPGERVNYNQVTKEIQKFENTGLNIIAWKTKQLKFVDEKLSVVIPIVANYFDKEIELTIEKEDCRFTGTFDNPKYTDVIEVLQFTYDLGYKASKTKDEIHIKSCN